MNDIPLVGCRSDQLSGYLKALGILRLVASQLDPHVRGQWSNRTFLLRTNADEASITAFFLEAYAPTPILNPWNSGAGFDAKSRPTQGRAFAQISSLAHPRFTHYASALTTAAGVLSQIDSDATLGKDERKTLILERLRRAYNDVALEWIDAAIILGRDDQHSFPPLLGSGGNDGRLDFAVNFAQRILDVIGPAAMRDVSQRLLHDSFFGSNEGRLSADKAIGQYAPGDAGGVNAANGFEAVSLINPWDYVLILEGAICFSAALARRNSMSLPYPVAPFTFRAPMNAGFASASQDEAVRGELWLPEWNGAASYASIRSMLRAGRLELNSGSADHPGKRSALSSLDGIHAILSFGSAHGLVRFQRVLIAQRNGLAFTASGIGSVSPRNDPGIADFSRIAIRWLSRLKADGLGQSGRAALRAYEEALVRLSQTSDSPQQRSRAFQEVVSALGELDRVVSIVGPKDVRPIPFLPPTLFKELDDHSDEHDLAQAFCGLGQHAGFSGHLDRVRYNIACVTPDMRYRKSPDVLWRPGQLASSLAAIAVRRALLVADGASRRPALQSAERSGTTLARISHFVEGIVDERRLERLIIGYALIDPAAREDILDPNARTESSVIVAAIRVMVDGISAVPGADRPLLDPTILSLFAARRNRRAVELLFHRLRASGYTPRRFADSLGLANSAIDGRRYAAAAVFPLHQASFNRARHMVSLGQPSLPTLETRTS